MKTAEHFLYENHNSKTIIKTKKVLKLHTGFPKAMKLFLFFIENRSELDYIKSLEQAKQEQNIFNPPYHTPPKN